MTSDFGKAFFPKRLHGRDIIFCFCLRGQTHQIFFRKGGLSASAAADDGIGSPGLKAGGNMAQNVLSRLVSEGNVPQLDAVLQP